MSLSEFAELLELVYGATDRVRSLRATLVERQRPQLLKRAFQRFGERVEFARGGGYFHQVVGGVAAGEEAGEHAWRIDLWAEPGRFRQERHGPDIESVLVVDGDQWWEWSPVFGLHSHEEQPGVHHHQAGLDLLDPSVFLSGYQLELAGETIAASRAVRRVRVRSRAAVRRPSHELQLGIEEAELLLDAERGLILRQAEIFAGEEAFVREVEQISYDLALPAETFVFELPPGASGRNLREPQLTTADAAAALASFPVFKLATVPPDWRVQAFYIPASEKPTLPELVTLVYSRSDGGQSLRLQQQTSEHELPTIGGERHFKHTGRDYLALGPERPIGLEAAELIFTLDQTKIRLTSSQVSLEQLLDYAQHLVRAE